MTQTKLLMHERAAPNSLDAAIGHLVIGSFVIDWSFVIRISSFTRRLFTLAIFLLLFLAPSVCAAPTQQDVFKSIQDSMGAQKEVDSTPVVVLACAGGLVLLIVIGLQFYQQRGQKAGVLNHPGRLKRELMREAAISSGELRQLRILSDSVESQIGEAPDPLTLLLCPSLIAKGLKSAPGKLDRTMLAGLVRKLKTSQKD